MLIYITWHFQVGHSQDIPPVQNHLSPTQFELSNGDLVEAERGSILVLENRQVPGSRFIPIHFVRFKSTSKNPSTPIVYLAGGPGGSGIQTAKRGFPFFDRLRETSDVIVFDQRGTGENDMTCPERVYLPIESSLRYEEVLSIFVKETLPCKAYFEKRGFDLSGYTTVESAHDVNDLRKALDLDKISLIGSSYGSHYALAILKLYEETIDRVVISGVEGPDHSMSLSSNFDKHIDDIDALMHEQQTSYDKTLNLKETIRKLLTRLDASPVTISTTNANTDSNENIQIGKFEVQLLLYSLLGRDRSIGQVPKLVFDMYDGEYGEAARMIYRLKSRGQSISAMLILMDGASGASSERLSDLQEQDNTAVLGPVVHFLFPEIAQAWEVPDLGPDYRTLITSERPVLIVSGSMDPRTPISNAEEIARGLLNSWHVTIKNSGHPQDLSSIADLIENFLLGGPITTEFAQGPTLEFVPIR